MALLKKVIVPDKSWKRPKTLGEARRQVAETYQANDWSNNEIASNCRMLGLKFKRLFDYTNDELQMILDDFEKYSMVLYED